MATVQVVYKGPAARFRTGESGKWHEKNGEPFGLTESALVRLSGPPYRHRFEVVDPAPPSKRSGTQEEATSTH